MTALITATSCARTRQIYDLIGENCPATLVLAVHERSCRRPSRHTGIGFPVTGEVADTIPMLVDMRHDYLKDWTKISLIHDDSVNRETLHDLVDGLASAEGEGVQPASVITYKVDVLRKRITPRELDMSQSVKDHSNCMRKGNPEHFSERHLTRHIESDPSLTNFILLGNQQTIETVVEEVTSKCVLQLRLLLPLELFESFAGAQPQLAGVAAPLAADIYAHYQAAEEVLGKFESYSG